jgi:alkaline phosphatase D
VQFVELDSHGASVIEVTPSSVQMDWYYVANRADPATTVTFAQAYRTIAGDPRVVPATGPIA